MTQIKKNSFVFHIIGWIAFIGFQFVLFPRPDKLFGNADAKPYIVDQFIINLIVIAFFYVNYYILIPRLYFKQKFGIFLLGILTFTMLGVLVVSITHYEKTDAPKNIPTNEKGIPTFEENPLAPPSIQNKTPRIQLNENILIYGAYFLKIILSFLLAIGFRIYGRWQKAEEEKYKAELSFLKAQINPHFLFNTLNGIYALAIKKSENTAPSIMKLSSIMRYVISEEHQDFVLLEDEIKYIKDYVELQKMRLATNIILDFEIYTENNNLKIAPLLLISFIENAFKHGLSSEEKCVIEIKISQKEDFLNLFVKNNKYKRALRENEKSGIGVENTKQRLQLLYFNKHQLVVEETETHYTTKLKLNLK